MILRRLSTSSAGSLNSHPRTSLLKHSLNTKAARRLSYIPASTALKGNIPQIQNHRFKSRWRSFEGRQGLGDYDTTLHSKAVTRFQSLRYFQSDKKTKTKTRKSTNGFPAFLIDENGSCEKMTLTKTQAVRDLGLQPRDLVFIGSGFHRKSRPVFLVREDVFVICMGYIRAAVMQDRLYLFQSNDYDISKFAKNAVLPLKSTETEDKKSNKEWIEQHIGTPATRKLIGGFSIPVEPLTEELAEPFECRALEGILNHICTHYYKKSSLLTPLVGNMLHELGQLRINQFKNDVLHRVLMMKNTMSEFEIETTLNRNCIYEVLQNDTDMEMMMLTRNVELKDLQSVETDEDIESDQNPSTVSIHEFQGHQEIELILENYVSQFVDISQEAYSLRKRIEATQGIIELQLDSHRNEMLKMNLMISMSALSLAFSTAVTGIFGMNLVNHLESHPTMFFYVVGLTTLVVVGTFFSLNEMSSSKVPQLLKNNNPQSTIFNHLDEVQFILGFAKAEKSFSKMKFKQALESRAGVQIKDDELDVVYRTFNLEKPTERLHSDEQTKFSSLYSNRARDL